MKQSSLLILSLLLNLMLGILIFIMAFIYRDKLTQKFVIWKGNGQSKIMMFGNSITAQGKWVALLGRTDVINSGFPGHCTYHFLDLIKSEIRAHKPQICFVMAGINDITVGVVPDKTQANYRTILETLINNGITPVVTLTLYKQNDTNTQQGVKQLNTFLVQYCSANKIDYIDLNRSLSDSNGLKAEFTLDGTHLNPDAYRIWAEAIKGVLTRQKI